MSNNSNLKIRTTEITTTINNSTAQLFNTIVPVLMVRSKNGYTAGLPYYYNNGTYIKTVLFSVSGWTTAQDGTATFIVVYFDGY